MKTKKTMKRYQDGGTNGTKGQGKLGPALGIGTTVGGAAALITKMIVDKVKSKKAAKAEEEKKKAADAAKKMTMQKMGGAAKYKMGGAKKYQMGGSDTYQGPVTESATKMLNKAYPLATGPRVYNQDVADAEENKQLRENYNRIPAQKRGGATKYKMGGAKKYQPGGPTTPAPAATPAVKKPAFAPPTPEENKALVSVYNQRNKTTLPDNTPMSPSSENFRTRSGGYNVYRTPNQPATTTPIPAGKKGGTKMAKGGMSKTKFMTGGMVNSNAKVSALKSAGSNGVKSGVNPKAKASTTAKGKTGGTSKAPTKATPTKNKRK